MLPADQLELITAAVDGELSATEARAFQRLLESSAEARALYTKLQNDSARVRRMPQVPAPADLTAKILARIAATTPAPRPRTARPAPTAPRPQPLTQPAHPAKPAPAHRFPTWVPVAIAASLLLCVTAGSFAFFNNQTSAKNAVAKNPWSNALPAPQEAPTAIPAPNTPPPPEQPRPDPVSVAKNDVSPVPPLPMPKVVSPPAVALAPEPRPVVPDLLGHQLFPKLPNFDLIQVRFPFLRTVAELDREDIRQELLDELGHDPAYRFDLFVRDTARGVDVFQHAAKATGLTVFADAATLDKLKKKQAHAVVIYTEALSAAELAALFARVGTEDAKYSPRVCDSLHATPIVRSDENELKAILGRDVGLYKRPVGSGGTGSNGAGQGRERGDRPVSAGTIDSVTKALTSPPAKPGEKPAVLMTWQTVPGVARTVPAMSAELKQYLTKRGDRKPGVVPAIIVIRPVV